MTDKIYYLQEAPYPETPDDLAYVTGKWRIAEGDSGPYRILCDKVIAPVATVNGERNARLISKAWLIPELVEALENFLRCQAPDGTKCAPDDRDFEQGKAVLAKAKEGRK